MPMISRGKSRKIKKSLSRFGTEIFCGATQIAGYEPAALSYAITYALLDNGQSAVDY